VVLGKWKEPESKMDNTGWVPVHLVHRGIRKQYFVCKVAPESHLQEDTVARVDFAKHVEAAGGIARLVVKSIDCSHVSVVALEPDCSVVESAKLIVYARLVCPLKRDRSGV
jgi:hypothetical protein